MAYFPDVTRGEAFKPNTLLSNNLRRLVNTMNGFDAKPLTATGGMIRIQVYNNSAAVIKGGTAVNFSENGTLCGDAVPAELLKDTAKPWGVVVNDLAAKALGSCVVSGPATVSLSGTGDYAEPSVSNPASFTRGFAGAPVLFASDGKGVIILGGNAADGTYDGPFALSCDTESKMLKIKAGFLSRNGEFKEVPGTELSPQTGTVCVCSTLDDEGNWSEPEIKFGTPGQFSYPVGNCRKNGESVTLCSFRVPVAILLAAGACDE